MKIDIYDIHNVISSGTSIILSILCHSASLTHLKTTECITLLNFAPLFVDRFGRSIRLFHLKFDKSSKVLYPSFLGGVFDF